MSFRIEPNAQPIPGYRLIERLGSGGFGEVWKTEAPGGIFKGIKFIHGDLRTRDNDLVRYAEQELKALNRVKTVRHPYLLSLDRIDIVEGRLMIIMELADCNLWDRFRHYRQNGRVGIPRDELLRYMIESAEVLDLMNDTFNLQHLDIKPQNLFLLHHHVKVADFGQVKDLQGTQAEVTGGITPVYAAPETFDGFISKFCDQYSLACVYQELLTGVRPFDGTSLQQLLLQHVEQPPNLEPSPPNDRAALKRALAKKPDQRFLSCTDFVQSLMSSVSAPRSTVTKAESTSRQGRDTSAFDQDSNGSSTSVEQTGRIEVSLPEVSQASDSQLSQAISVEMTGTPSRGGLDTPFPERKVTEVSSLIAPPEETGPGTLRPTLVIGLGGQGQMTLRYLQKTIWENYGHPDRLPIIRTVYIDTDPVDLESCLKNDHERSVPGLLPDQVVPARLRRAGHYLKPRLSGKSLIEGWFDSQLLNRLSRTPVTGGFRVFGRLAYCDTFRNLAARLQSEIATALDPLALEISRQRSGLTLATNRPRVYVVGGLAGGTASGMFLDLTYTIRAQLKYLGYTDPDIVGIFFLPPDLGMSEANTMAQANVYAALTELNHYSREETIFQATYDDHHGNVRDAGKPFKSVYFLPGGEFNNENTPRNGSSAIGMPGRRSSSQVVSGSSMIRGKTRTLPSPVRTRTTDPASTAADIVRFDLMGPIGRTAESVRPAEKSDGPVMFRSVGTAKFSWPRGEVLHRTSTQIARAILANWITVDINRARETIPTWTSEAWSRMGLDPDPLIHRLMQSAHELVRMPFNKYVDQCVERLTPKGWLSRGVDPNAVSDVFQQLVSILGHPVSSANPSPLESLICPQAVAIAKHAEAQLSESLPRLSDDIQLRLSGTLEAAHQFLATIERLVTRYAPIHEKNAQQSRFSFEQLMGITQNRRKASSQDVTEAIRQFATCRVQSIVVGELIAILKQLKAPLKIFIADASACRARLEAELTKDVTEEAAKPRPRAPRELLPVGCPSVEAAIEAFTATLNDDDLTLLERRIQSTIIEKYDGVFNACLNTTDGIKKLIDVIQEETRSYLNVRLNDVDLLGMLAAQYRTEDAARAGLLAAYEEAEPNIAGPGPWKKQEFCVLQCPATVAGLASSVPTENPLVNVESRDDIVYYRELPLIPLAALPQLGPIWENAYQSACEMVQGNPHNRADVTKWIPIDAG